VTLEEFLVEKFDESGKVVIVGGSPLFEEELPEAISINGFHKECSIAAINSNRSDVRRTVGKFSYVMAPRPKKKVPDSVLVPRRKYLMPNDFPGREPTTYFSLIMICEMLEIPTEVYGICGRASKYHYGDWEMWHMMHRTKYITINDPRPAW
jgi:hypothetical protein